jgi:hypothetical protein
MSGTDLQTRNVSVPFEPQEIIQQVFGVGVTEYADVYTLPYGMNITELYLNLKVIAPSAQALAFKLVIGKINDNYTANYNLTDAEIKKAHVLITGQTAKYSVPAGTELFLDGLSLKKAIVDNRKDDAFCFYILWDVEPDFSSSGLLETHLYGSAVLGVL